jgi:predicted nucleic acid-binding protein
VSGSSHTAPLIYFVEENPSYLEIVEAFFTAFDRGEFRIITSTITLTEVLVHPLRMGNTDIAQAYREILLHQDNLEIVPTSTAIAERAARL